MREEVRDFAKRIQVKQPRSEIALSIHKIIVNRQQRLEILDKMLNSFMKL
jgi:hypothetical protein